MPAMRSSTQLPQPSTIRKVGFIGLGLAGGPLCECVLKAGFEMVVRDADRTRQECFVQANRDLKVISASDEPDAFKDVDVVITMVPNGNIVRDILFGDRGIAPYLKAGCVVIDTSSSDPFNTMSMGETLNNMSVHLIDSPVTQVRMHGLNDGEATFMLGGEPEVIAAVEPVLASMSKWRFHMGPLGSGHVMKTFNNYVTAAGIAALNDCFMVGAKMGLDAAQITEVLNVGTGRCYGTSHSIRAESLTRTYKSGYGLALLVKDLGINRDLMAKVGGVDTTLAERMLLTFKKSLGVNGVKNDADYTECLKLWERDCGVQLPTYEGLKECEEPRDKIYID